MPRGGNWSASGGCQLPRRERGAEGVGAGPLHIINSDEVMRRSHSPCLLCRGDARVDGASAGGAAVGGSM
eukprot:6851860-Prorocentrum_lima.AAC.1